MEYATEQDEQLISSVYTRVMDAVHATEAVTNDEELVFQVELLSQEVNSGASFEQYFRWVGFKELQQICGLLQQLGLTEVNDIVTQAISVAFPVAIPENDEQYEAATDWEDEQLELMEQLFEQFEQYNAVITTKLAEFIRHKGIAAS